MKTTKTRILYVEDHDDTRELLTLVLQAREYEVTTAENTESALKLAEAEKFHLYLLDSWLPDGSGIELCKKIRQFDRRTPIIFYSAAAYEADKEGALTAGAQGYLTKPASITELCDLVANLITAGRADDDGNPPVQTGLTHLWLSSETEG